MSVSNLKAIVEVKDPLKQGLKLKIDNSNNNISIFVEVKDPLKQGLKLSIPINFDVQCLWLK